MVIEDGCVISFQGSPSSLHLQQPLGLKAASSNDAFRVNNNGFDAVDLLKRLVSEVGSNHNRYALVAQAKIFPAERPVPKLDPSFALSTG